MLGVFGNCSCVSAWVKYPKCSLSMLNDCAFKVPVFLCRMYSRLVVLLVSQHSLVQQILPSRVIHGVQVRPRPADPPIPSDPWSSGTVLSSQSFIPNRQFSQGIVSSNRSSMVTHRSFRHVCLVCNPSVRLLACNALTLGLPM